MLGRARRGVRREKTVGAPDMVLEVLSPRPRIGTLQERIEESLDYLTPIRSHVLPDFRMTVEDILRE